MSTLLHAHESNWENERICPGRRRGWKVIKQFSLKYVCISYFPPDQTSEHDSELDPPSTSLDLIYFLAMSCEVSPTRRLLLPVNCPDFWPLRFIRGWEKEVSCMKRYCHFRSQLKFQIIARPFFKKLMLERMLPMSYLEKCLSQSTLYSHHLMNVISYNEKIGEVWGNWLC